MMNRSSATLELGRLGRAHGLRGELRLELFWNGSTTIFDLKRVLLRWPEQEREQEMRLVSARAVDRGALVQFEGVVDRTAAEALTGARVCVYREDLPELAPGEYYLADLVGAEVYAPDGLVGKVVEICFYPTTDALIIETVTGERCEQALSPPWVDRVDVAAARVELTSREGLIV